MLALAEAVELNDFYSMLNLDPTARGAILGWSLPAGAVNYGYSWIDFYHEYIEGNEDEPGYYRICMPFGPTADYLDF